MRGVPVCRRSTTTMRERGCPNEPDSQKSPCPEQPPFLAVLQCCRAPYQPHPIQSFQYFAFCLIVAARVPVEQTQRVPLV